MIPRSAHWTQYLKGHEFPSLVGSSAELLGIPMDLIASDIDGAFFGGAVSAELATERYLYNDVLGTMGYSISTSC